MIKFVGFDLDGTLLNSLPDLTDAVNYGLEGQNLPRKTTQQVRSYIGNGAEILIQKACFPVTDKQILKSVRNGFDDYYHNHYDAKSHLYDGVEALLDYLKDHQIQTAILSNKPDQFVKLIVKRMFLGYSFTDVLGQSERFPKKPNPQGLLHFKTKLALSSEECVYIGDSDVDIMTAKRAKVISIGAAWGYRSKEELRQAGADYIADTPWDIKTIFINL
mgnify:CR=1 FL=1